MAADILSSLDREHFIWQGNELVARATVADSDEVNMGVHQSGHDSGVAVVELLDWRALRRLDCLCGAYLPDRVTFEKYSGLFRRRASVAVYQPRGPEYSKGAIGCWHVRSPAYYVLVDLAV